MSAAGRARAAAAMALALATAAAGCQHGSRGPFLSIAQLNKLADGVPVPTGVSLLSQSSGTTFNATTGVKSNQVNRIYSTTLGCLTVQAEWERLLSGAHLHWQVLNPPAPEPHVIRVKEAHATVNISLGALYPRVCRRLSVVVDDLT